MRWALYRRHRACATDEAIVAGLEADRALRDAKAMTSKAAEMARRANEVAEKLKATRERNHVAEAVVRAIRGVS